MQYPNAQYGYRPGATEGAIINKRPSYQHYEDDDSAVLDPGILDAEIMQSPADAQPRRGSYVNGNGGVLTPVESQGWNPAYGTGGLPVEPSQAGPAHFYHDERNNFSGRAPPPLSTYGHPQHPDAWAFEHSPGHCTPTNVPELEFIQPHPHTYEHGQYVHHRNDSARASFSHPPHPPQQFNPPHPDGAFAVAPQVQTPMSPHSNQDWMVVADAERNMSKRLRTGSPPRTSVDLQRRDGIRKKNGRIDIPLERNINTIDELIEQATDDETLKELKQQKRLLRNREAALASRQRKKKHTEDLESQQKSFSQQVGVLEDQIRGLHHELRTRERNYQILVHQFQESKRANEILQEEKRDMGMKHIEETASLRKKIQVLNERIDAGPAPMMSAQPSSAGFNEVTGDMGALTMGIHDWNSFGDNFDLFNDDDFPFDPKPEQPARSPLFDKRTSPVSVAANSENKTTDSFNETPVASGLLFFLLLCGAFVASRPASSQPSDLPQVPDDVRAAAPAVLNNLLSDSGSSSTQQGRPGSGRTAFEPAPSGLPQARPSGRLDQIHRRITSPTKEQEANSAFSLTTQQYASISGVDYLSHNEQPESSSRHHTPPSRRRNLAEMLGNMQEEQTQHNKAEVYTRSLLWDQIPTDVVQQFKEMVRDHHELETRQQIQTSHDDMYGLKAE